MLGLLDKTPVSARIAAAAAIRVAKEAKAKKVASIVHGAGIGGLGAREAAQATVEGALLGEYEFEGYKTENPKSKIEELVIVEKDKKKAKIMEEGVKLGEILAGAENRARDLVNAPANKVTPTYLANYAKKMAREAGLKCEILDPKEEGMEAIWAVAKGSREPAKVIVLEKQTTASPSTSLGASSKRKAERIALIGKGITFDSGGISLKPSKKLWEMKTDMAGAAAVIETMRAIAQLEIKKSPAPKSGRFMAQLGSFFLPPCSAETWSS